MKRRQQTGRPQRLSEAEWQRFREQFTPEQWAKVEVDAEYQAALKADDHLKAQAVAQNVIYGVYESELHRLIERENLI